MDILEVQASLKAKYPNLNFALQKPTYKHNQSLLANIYNREKKIRFEVMFELDRDILIMHMCLGEIKPDYEVAFFLNKLNTTLPVCYKATIEKVIGCNRYCLFVRYLQPIAFPEQVPNIFLNASNSLFNNIEFKILYKYVKQEDLKKTMN